MAKIVKIQFGLLTTRIRWDESVLTPAPVHNSSLEDDAVFPNTEEGRLALLRDLKYLAEYGERITAVRDRLNEITEYIFSMADFKKSDRNVELRREGLKSASLENLVHIVLESDKMQWQTKPNYFGSIVLEYTDRVNILIKIFPKEKRGSK